MNKGSRNQKSLVGKSETVGAAELKTQLERAEIKLHQTELLLSVTQKIAGLNNLSEILWTLIDMTTQELGADRGSLFLNDPLTGELYSRVAQGELTREIRILNTTGIAGAVFKSGLGEIVHYPYDDERFNSKIDEQTGKVGPRTLKDFLLAVDQNPAHVAFYPDEFKKTKKPNPVYWK